MFAQENDHNLILLRMDHAQQNNRKESEVSYTYDPANPTPQIGGATFNPSNCGRLAQNEIEESGRDDILVFTSKPIVDQPMTIAGEMKVRLMVESNVEGTDYVARVCHVTPNNISQNIAEGIVRRFDLQPGKRTRIEITLSPVMNRLAIGDRLRIHICSSSYPKYGRHLNTRESFHLEVERNAMLSKQRLILGGTNGSHMLIPFLS
jgi:putative CocE/NonD family hydrolase